MAGDRTAPRFSWIAWVCRVVVFLTLGGCALMLGLDYYHEARTKETLAKLQKSGGFFARDDTAPRHPVISIDLDAEIVYDSGVVRKRGRVTDDTLRIVADFPELRELSLKGADVTDAGLVSLRGLRMLERLNLSQTSLTDAALPYFKGLARLRMIDLRGTQWTPAGIRELRRTVPLAEVVADELE
jgi:hypothetical protein